MKSIQKCGSLLLAAALLLGLFPGLMPTAWAATDITDKFTDPNFRAAVYEVIWKKAPAPIYDTDVARVEDLHLTMSDIRSLAGLEYFTNLTSLYCSGNKLTSLPALPSGLEYLHCEYNELTSLPALPSGLEYLHCEYNKLTSLPVLPSGLQALGCSMNQLTSLPTLPTSLFWLSCNDNLLTSLDVSGLNELGYLDCSGNNITNPSDVKGFTDTWNSEGFVFEPQNSGYLPLLGLSDWAEKESNSLNARGVIPTALKGNFQDFIRRDEFMALLVKIFENVSQDFIFPKAPFTDIYDSPYRRAIEKAYTIYLIDGTSATTFTPSGLLTREQTAKLLYTMVEKIEGAELGSGTPDFTDNDKISGWAKPYVAYAQAHDLMQGNGGQFDPQGHLTREQAMLVAERLIARYGW